MLQKMTMLFIAILMGALLLLGVVTSAAADGTETLDPPDSLPAADRPPLTATGMALDGTTPCDCGAGNIEIEVPADATIKQVLLYWYSAVEDQDATTAISVTTEIGGQLGNWQLINGQRIGGPTPFWDAVNFATFRSDITELNLVTPGTSIVVVDLPYDTLEEAAGLMVFYDQPDQIPQTIDYRDGQDLAFFQYAGDLKRTVPQEFTLEPREAHTVTLFLMVGSIMPDRPNQIIIEVGGVRTVYDDPLCANCGLFWDTLELPLDVPAEASSLSVELVSPPREDPLGASLNWIVAGVAQPQPPDEPTISLTVTETYSWTYTVENIDDDLALEAIKVRAGPAVAVTCGADTLAVGASMKCDATSQSLAHYGSIAWLYAEPVGGGYPVVRWLEPELTP